MGSLYVSMSYDNGVTWQGNVFYQNGNKWNSWKQAGINLAGSSQMKLKIFGITEGT